jgi:threonine synthase
VDKPLPYLSTRDATQPPDRLPFDEVLLAGLAPDGGLYVPTAWPRLATSDLADLKGKSYAEIAVRVMTPFLDGVMAPKEFQAMVADAYRDFDDPEVAPLRDLGDGLYLLELFHGPTLAFKDYALQLVGRLFDHVLAKRRARVTIVGATSGDTGSAAIAACRDRDAIDIFMLYPKGRISEVQRRQMTSVAASNGHAIAVDGTFDDCQDLVKAMFADVIFREELNLSAVNSINWARIMAQIVYYVVASVKLGAPERAVSFAVPTGNFGNVYAAHAARRMGLAVAELVIGTNRNDILARFINDGAMTIGDVEPSYSPSMDIQVSSNFERLYFELRQGDAAGVATAMAAFRRTGTLPASRAEWQEAAKLFAAARVDDDGILAEIAATYRATGVVLDPHSAVAVAAAKAKRRDRSIPMVALATAHPAKFPDAVERAIGQKPAMPARLAAVMDLPERAPHLPRDLAAIEGYVRRHARAVPAGATS